MMRARFFLLALLFSFSVFAASGSRSLTAAVESEMSMDLQAVPIRDLVRLVYSEMLRKSYVLDSEILAENALVSFSVSGKPGQIEAELVELIRSHGYVVEQGPVVRIYSAKKGVASADVGLTFVYVPEFRSVSYLVNIASPLFHSGVFAGSRSGPSFSQLSGAVSSSGFPSAASSRSSAQQGRGDTLAADSVSSPFQNQGVNAQAAPDLDVLVYQGVDSDISRLKALLAQLDTPVPEMMVRAAVYEVQTSEGESSAVSLALSLLAGRVGVKLSSGSALDNALTVKAGDVSAVFSALSSDSRFKQLSSPSLRVQSGKSARLVVGADVPVVGAVSYQQNGAPVQAVEYKSSGVILDLKPVVRGSRADLSIDQQVSGFIQTTTGVNNSPTLTKRQLTTSVSVGSDEVVILGGLEESKESHGFSGLSFLPRFLGGNSSQSGATELMLVIHARRI